MPLHNQRIAEQDHRSQPAMAGEFYSEIQSVNTAIAGGWVQAFSRKMASLVEVTTPDIAGLRGPYKVIRLAVADHSEVQVGDIIAEVDGPDATVEIETFDAGRVEFVVGIGQLLEPNQLIANVSSSKPHSGCSLRLELQSKHLQILDGFRGSLSRHDYILSLITNLEESDGEQAAS